MKKTGKVQYKPPYTLSETAILLISEIAAALERYRIVMEGPDGVWLRKINHVKTIRGTTAIEGNTLTEEQVTAVLAGKRVAAPRREIDEIKGAHAAYGLLKKVDPFFYAAPVENIVFSNQEKYYRAINESTAKVDCGPFIDFMLERILKKREMAGTLRFPEG